MNGRPFILKETNWLEVNKFLFDVAILPWGATEPHNYHLPFGTDYIQSEYIAYKSAEMAWNSGSKIIVLPTVPWGVNTGQTDLKLCLNIFPTTQLVLLKDLAENLIRHNILKLVIINSHGGNDFIPLIRELSVKLPELFICCIDWWRVCKAGEYFTEPGDHAGEMETSIMMVIEPDLLLPLEKSGDGKSKNFKISGLQERWAWAQRKWSAISDSTGVGNPKPASKEKGKAFIDASLQKISSFLTDLSNTPVSDMYEK